MKENRLKEEFFTMEVPEMKTDIMQAIHSDKKMKIPRKLRPVSIVAITALLAVLAVTAGAMTNGMLNVKSGSKYSFRDTDGKLVTPNGFHLDEEVDVSFSEKALENITPYITTPPEPANLYETTVREEIETFLDMPLYLPGTITEEASLYRLWVIGADGKAVSIHLQIGTDEQVDAMDVYLRGSPGVIGTVSEPVMEQYALPDGTPVSIAIAKSKNGGMVGHALYKYNDAVYHLRVFDEDRYAVIEHLQTVLDSVE